MKSELSPASPGRHYPEDVAWSISASTRQGAQEADACMVSEYWQYGTPSPPTLVPPDPVPQPTPSR